MASKPDYARAVIAALNREGIRRYEDLGHYTVESLGERLGRVGPGAPSSQHNRKVAEFLFDQREHGWLGAIEEKHLLKAELPGEEDFPGWGQKR